MDAIKCGGACGLTPRGASVTSSRSGSAATWIANLAGSFSQRVLVHGHGSWFVFGNWFSGRRQAAVCRAAQEKHTSYMASPACAPGPAADLTQ